MSVQGCGFCCICWTKCGTDRQETSVERIRLTVAIVNKTHHPHLHRETACSFAIGSLRGHLVIAIGQCTQERKHQIAGEFAVPWPVP